MGPPPTPWSVRAPPTPVSMARMVSAPGLYVARPMHAPRTPTQQATGLFLAPVQAITPGTWLPGTHNVGYEPRLHGPQQLGSPIQMPSPSPATSRPTPSRSQTSSAQNRRPLHCSYTDCRQHLAGKIFKTPGELRKHERNHLPESERPHECLVVGCPRRFWWPKDRTRHIEVVHEGVRVQCEQCGNTLCRGDDLARHVATVHGAQGSSERNWAAPSPSVSSVTTSFDYAMTPQSEYSFPVIPGTPLSSFDSASRPKARHWESFGSMPGSVPMEKSLTR